MFLILAWTGVALKGLFKEHDWASVSKRCPVKKVFLIFFPKIHKKIPASKFTFNKVASCGSATTLKETPAGIFFSKFRTIFKDVFDTMTPTSCF